MKRKVLAVLVLGALASGCSTVSKVGGAFKATGDVLSAIGDIVIDGAAKDMTDTTTLIGISAPPAEAAPVPAPAPVPNP